VLDEIGGVADDSRNQDLSGREFHVAPDFVFMFVPGVAAVMPIIVSEIAEKKREADLVQQPKRARESAGS
jgi:hypothetical protein